MSVRFCWRYEGLFFPPKDSPGFSMRGGGRTEEAGVPSVVTALTCLTVHLIVTFSSFLVPRLHLSFAATVASATAFASLAVVAIPNVADTAMRMSFGARPPQWSLSMFRN